MLERPGRDRRLKLMSATRRSPARQGREAVGKSLRFLFKKRNVLLGTGVGKNVPRDEATTAGRGNPVKKAGRGQPPDSVAFDKNRMRA